MVTSRSSRQPDAVDGARVLALGFLAMAMIAALARESGSNLLEGVLLQLSFLLIPLVYAREVGMPPLKTSGFVRLSGRQAALVVAASLGSFWLLLGLSQIQAGFFEWMGLGEVVKLEEEQIRAKVEALRQNGLGFPPRLL